MVPQNDLIPIRILHEFTERLDNLAIPYMLTGSMAMFAYSIYRYTADIDLVIELGSGKVPQFVAAFEGDYYISASSAHRAVSSERMFNVINTATGFKVDCVIRKSTDFQRMAFGRRSARDISGKEIFVITIEDLILSKLAWAAESRSDKQMTDISNLLMAEHNRQYLEEWAEKLSVGAFLNECRTDRDT